MVNKPQPRVLAEPLTDAAKNESEFVHDVYNQIAPHFSNTRYKAWPVVESFLNDREAGSVGADVGCGNGKYMGVNRKLMVLGSDRSIGLLEITQGRGFEATLADNLALPYRSDRVDFVISIAVIHHFSTPERRLQAIRELVRILRPGGQALVFVWALEQKGKRKFDQDHQDFMVPWVVPRNTASVSGVQTEAEVPPPEEAENDRVFHRYYHLFREHELETLITESDLNSAVEIADNGYDRDNWYVVLTKRIPE
ncbi:uracil-5--methyltransferase TRM9 [Dimargaris cristalligena]|uniref:Uracil-5--methyltransferase TRM9 n=1 Tax=Dimargaris cristalligena TaxID=215637 RepID=A0A4P9ZN40_9FUNG|nr:uracil-5--methyltransferase TRM9 [Dimargaris cristalligena]|eukprot:RKP34011.1 uracil-5--methyltransferase TRM9 [Dimargaris cristalligena]